MIEKKVFDKISIINEVKDKYDINVNNVETINGGSAEIYLLNGEIVLKLFQSKYGVNDIKKETDVVTYLKNKDYIVPRYYATKSGEYFAIYKNRVYTLQEYISGSTKEKFEASTSEIMECGLLHGKLVKNLIDFKIEEKQEVEEYLEFSKSINKLQKVIEMGTDSVITRELKEKQEMLRKIDAVTIGQLHGLSYYVSHGDFSYLQFIYGESNCKAIIDFVRVKKLPIAWEIIRSYSYMDKCCETGEINIDNLKLYIKEFMKNTKLTLQDLKYMPYIYLYQLLASTYGYKEVYTQNNTSALEFARFRTRLCKYLYYNVEKISQSLEELL